MQRCFFTIRLTSLKKTMRYGVRNGIFVDRGNCCRRLKIDAACCASIRTNGPRPSHCRAHAIGRITCNASRQNYRNHTNDKIFPPRGNFASSTMARDRSATIPERVLSLIAIRHDATTGKIVCKW